MLLFLVKMYDYTCNVATSLFGFVLNPVFYILFLTVILFKFLIFFSFRRLENSINPVHDLKTLSIHKFCNINYLVVFLF